MKQGPYKENSIILRKTAYSESDYILSFLTRPHGRVEGIARHGRKSIKRFGASLSSLGLVDMHFTVKPHRELVWLDKGEVLEVFDGLAVHPANLGAAEMALEIVEAFIRPLDPAPEVFDLLVWALRRINAGQRPAEALFIFQVKLLTLTGFGPNLAACGVCGRDPHPGEACGLSPEADGLACPSCVPGAFIARPGALKSMHLIQKLAPERLDRVRVAPEALREAGPFLLAYLRRLLGRDLNSARFLEQFSRGR